VEKNVGDAFSVTHMLSHVTDVTYRLIFSDLKVVIVTLAASSLMIAVG
jgi:hypothetical protein